MIATNAVGNSKELVFLENGWILPDNSVGNVVDVYRVILNSSDERLTTMGRLSQSIAKESFSRSIVAKAFVSDLLQQFPRNP